MIINNKNIDVSSEGEVLQSTKTELDVDNIGFIINMLSKFYSDGVGSTIREWVSNSLDSHVEAGVNKPIIVKLFPEEESWWLSVQDFGVGVNQETIDNIFSKYGKSTKRHSNDFLGAMGLGLKSGLSYSSYFIIDGVKNGISGKWIFREDESGSTIDLLYNNIPTNEENGATFKIPVLLKDKSTFSYKLREQLCYFKNIYVEDSYSTFDNDFLIYESQLFKHSSICKDRYLHICLGDVYYPIDYMKLGIDRIEIPIALKFGLGEGINPTENRENIKYTSDSKAIILERIKEVGNWLVDKYNEDTKYFKTWKEGREFIKNEFYSISIEGMDFVIDSILCHCTQKIQQIQQITIEGFNSEDLFFLKKRENYICDIVTHYGAFSNGRYNSKTRGRRLPEFLHQRNLITNKYMIGNYREYLKELYPNYFIWTYNSPRILGNKKDIEAKYNNNRYYTGDNRKYIDLLRLFKYPKDKWRQLIKQAQLIEKEYKEQFIDVSNLEVPQEWINSRKVKRKQESKALNKGEGEISLSLARKSAKDNYNIVYGKSTYKIKNLNKFEKVVIYSDNKEDKDKLSTFNRYLYNKKLNKYTTGIVNIREKKHISSINQFIKFEKIMELKLLKRFFTAHEAWYTIESLKKFYNKERDIPIMNALGGKYKDSYFKLKSYVEKNIDWEFRNSELGKEIVEWMKANNKKDEEVWSKVEELRGFSDSIQALSLIEVPRKEYGEEEEQFKIKQKNYLNLVHKFLIFEKVHKGNFENWSLCPPASVDEELFIDKGIEVDQLICQ